MKHVSTHSSRTPLLAALLIISCSQSPTAPTATPGKSDQTIALGEGGVRSLAAGDVNVGPNPIDMNLVRVSQTNGVAAFYANPGGEYLVLTGADVEVYVQIWSRNPPVENPRLIVDWGNGQRDNVGCGGCRLSSRYETEGKYKVTVTMDDRVSSTTTRTFTLNVKTKLSLNGFGDFKGALGGAAFEREVCSSVQTYFYESYTIHHPGGHLHIETVDPTAICDTYLYLYTSFSPTNACNNIVASNDDNGKGPCGFWSTIDGTFPPGDYVAVVTTFAAGATGAYTLFVSQ